MIRLYWKGDKLALGGLVKSRPSDKPEFDWMMQSPNCTRAWRFTYVFTQQLRGDGMPYRVVVDDARERETR